MNKKATLIRLIIFPLLFIISCFLCFGILAAADTPVVKDSSKKANFMMLMANQEKWSGEMVSVTGYIGLGLEEQALYGYKDDIHSFFDRGIWLSWKDEDDKQLDAIVKKIQAKYGKEGCRVRCDGRFHAGWRGHLELFAGEIFIETIQVLDSL